MTQCRQNTNNQNIQVVSPIYLGKLGSISLALAMHVKTQSSCLVTANSQAMVFDASLMKECSSDFGDNCCSSKIAHRNEGIMGGVSRFSDKIVKLSLPITSDINGNISPSSLSLAPL